MVVELDKGELVATTTPGRDAEAYSPCVHGGYEGG